MNTNREIIDARIFNYLKHTLSPHYKVVNIRTRWIGQKEEERFYDVRYFVTSKRFVAGVRYERVSVTGKEVRILYDDFK